jgi:hypothetical protein
MNPGRKRVDTGSPGNDLRISGFRPALDQPLRLGADVVGRLRDPLHGATTR